MYLSLTTLVRGLKKNYKVLTDDVEIRAGIRDYCTDIYEADHDGKIINVHPVKHIVDDSVKSAVITHHNELDSLLNRVSIDEVVRG